MVYKKMTIEFFVFIAILLKTSYAILDIEGDYCRSRPTGNQCCPGRDDSCGAPILGTMCYCDKFCNRTSDDDCCPDFWSHCLGIRKPDPEPYRICYKNGRNYVIGQKVRQNCNTCTCSLVSNNLDDKPEIYCENNDCLIDPGMIEIINRSNLGWKASNYSMFWGKTLDEGIRYRLGTFKPNRLTVGMNEIHIKKRPYLPTDFDARQKWRDIIQPIRDQGDCASSWAFSTTALASDRLGIQSNGTERKTLSPQNLLSCQNGRQKGCSGGHLDRAWWYIRKYGVVTEECYPYTSGSSGSHGRCDVSRLSDPSGVSCRNNPGAVSMLYKSAPPYKISSHEEEIMNEIYRNGPVQATFKVHRDFFMYRRGIYEHFKASPGKKFGYHSVRIIGWGIDRSNSINPIKYWLCANSWGRRWGENGYFRILRGENECDIEMFVIGVWAKRNTRRNKIDNNGIPEIFE
ncbi:TINAGL1 (predicted) [Pycnogonum litorale]